MSNFDNLKNTTVILALGSTGNGKSTLLNSLVNGSDTLQMKIIDKII